MFLYCLIIESPGNATKLASSYIEVLRTFTYGNTGLVMSISFFNLLPTNSLSLLTSLYVPMRLSVIVLERLLESPLEVISICVLQMSELLLSSVF